MVGQSLGIFLFSAVVISLSGVLSPGPMTAAVVGQGGRSRLAGLYVSLGHGAVEMPLIALIFFGAGGLLAHHWVRVLVGAAGGIYLLFMGKGLLGAHGGPKAPEGRGASSVTAGVVLSVGNPYFLLWWATVGVGLVTGAAGFGLKGLLLFALVHWLTDLIWLSVLSVASHKGMKAFGAGRKVSVVCGLALIFYGGLFLYGSLKMALWG
jgi:threonine/homoserine/homoserine lactone efflux protein